MRIADKLKELIADACVNKKPVILVMRDYWCEGIVEKIYEHEVVKVVASRPGAASTVTGFLLISDVLEVLRF